MFVPFFLAVKWRLSFSRGFFCDYNLNWLRSIIPIVHVFSPTTRERIWMGRAYRLGIIIVIVKPQVEGVIVGGNTFN
jgi:hypothetical protein